MPRGVRVEKPVIQDSIEQPIQAATILVLHPGSTTLWLGRATDHFPQSIPHVLARRKPSNAFASAALDEECLLARDGLQHPDSETQRGLALSVVEQAIWSRKTSSGSKRQHYSTQQVANYNAKVTGDVLSQESGVHRTDTSSAPNMLIGEEALHLNPDDAYNVHWPMRKGQLNLHDGPCGSLMSVLSDLEVLWALAIQSVLDIPVKDFQHYKVVLVVPAMFNKQHIKEMMNILLCQLGFNSAIVQQEAVSAAFGSGMISACVVDVGDQKTTISCIEDGLVIPNSRLWLHYGGRDVTQAFYWLLKRINFPYREFNPNSKFDFFLLQDLKETFCHLNQDIVGGQVHEFQVHKPGCPSLSYKLMLGDEAMQAPMALFFPQLFGLVGEKLVSSIDNHYDDPEDIFGDRYLLESGRGRGTLTGDTSGTADQTEQDVQPVVTPTSKNRQLPSITEKSVGLDMAIFHSIDSCTNDETKRKMYSNILLVGGGYMFNGNGPFLQSRLQAKLPQMFRKQVDQVEVISRPKDMDPRTVCWKGAAVLSILDSAQELWITKAEWVSIGVRILRERSPFVWPI